MMWTKIEKEAQSIEENRDNLINLPGAKLPKNVKVTLDLEEACKDKDIIVMAVASPYIKATAKKPSPLLRKDKL